LHQCKKNDNGKGVNVMKTDPKTQEVWIEAVKSCGQSLIDNAEEIAGDYEYETGVTITISLKPHETAEINIATTYIPKLRGTDRAVCMRNRELFINTEAFRKLV
jgi:hypothetical protein